jgi:hypothetical protein
VYDPTMTFTILSGRWVGNTGCPAKSLTKGGHPIENLIEMVLKLLEEVSQIRRDNKYLKMESVLRRHGLVCRHVCRIRCHGRM